MGKAMDLEMVPIILTQRTKKYVFKIVRRLEKNIFHFYHEIFTRLWAIKQIDGIRRRH